MSIPFNYQTRFMVVMLFIPLVSLYSTAKTLIDIPPVKLNNFSTNEISNYEHRFDGLRQLLPKNATVGYFFVKPISSTAQLPQEYYLTQYALSPVIVTASTNPELSIGNFVDQATKRQAEKTFRVVKDFGNGVVLLCHIHS